MPFAGEITRLQWMLACAYFLTLASAGCGRARDRAYSRGSTLTVAYCCGKQTLTPHALFRDPRVRQALTLAINRREIVRLLNLPESTPVIDGPYTVRQLRRGGLPEPLPYDPRQAGALLGAAGYRDRDGDGVREREGKPFRFAAIVSSQPGFSEIAVYVQEQLRRVGVLMDIRMLDQGSARRALASGKFEAGLSRTGWSANALQPLFGENSFIGYRNAAVATLLRRLSLAMDPSEDDRLRRELAEIFRADVPATFLFQRVNTVFAHRRIRGLSTPWRADPIRFMGDLWLEDGSQQ